MYYTECAGIICRCHEGSDSLILFIYFNHCKQQTAYPCVLNCFLANAVPARIRPMSPRWRYHFHYVQRCLVFSEHCVIVPYPTIASAPAYTGDFWFASLHMKSCIPNPQCDPS